MNWLVGVVCLMSVGAARYGDYSGVKMPQYNIEYDNSQGIQSPDDYKDHSPDAAPSLDYRYDDDSRDRTAETEDQSWRKRSSKKKVPKLSDSRVDLNTNDNSMPKSRSHRRFHKRRSKSKQRNAGENKRYSNYERQYDDADLNNDFPKKRKDDDEVESNFDFKYTTQKIIRRKVRDRTLSQERIESDSDEDLERIHVEDDIERLSDGSRRVDTERIRPPEPERRKFNLKNYAEDDEYFDMKRVNNLKQKLPGLLRRTKVENSSTESSSEIPEDIITTYRRANINIKIANETTQNIETTVSIIMDAINITSKALNLSLAEKSRLSILKSQKKDSVRNLTWTTKPPVLMQVTSKMQTMVVVEPNNQMKLHAREIFEDTSERVAKAKKLMRHKLVSGARSIQDLTDNWDEMVCDYIDVSLLENSGIGLEVNVFNVLVICNLLFFIL